MSQILKSLKRGALRLSVLLVLGIILVYSTETWPEFFGSPASPLLRGFGLSILGLAVADFVLRILQPHVDTTVLADDALYNKNVASGIVYFGRCFLAGVILFLIATASRAEVMPPNAVKYSPLLVAESINYWPAMELVSLLGAQVEQETCTSLKSKYCWSPLARLSTSRETGVSFGQLTKAFSASGAVRFDALTDIANKYPKDLKGLSWSNWKDPVLQMRAYVLMMRDNAKKYTDSATQLDQMSFTFASYNAGIGSVNSSKNACRATKGCNSKVWFGNVETASLQSKTVIPGYGQSPYQITTTYVKNVEQVRRVRYLPLDKATA